MTLRWHVKFVNRVWLSYLYLVNNMFGPPEDLYDYII